MLPVRVLLLAACCSVVVRPASSFTHGWDSVGDMLAGNFGSFHPEWNGTAAALPRWEWVAKHYALVALNDFGAFPNTKNGRWNCSGENPRVTVARTLKKLNPKIKLLWYQAASWVTSSHCAREPLDSNSSWWLRDDDGTPLRQGAKTSGMLELDPRVPEARKWWAELPLSGLLPRGDRVQASKLIDGIFCDGSGFRNPSRNISDTNYQEIFDGKMQMLAEAQTMYSALSGGEVWGNPLVQYADIGTTDPVKAGGAGWNLTLQHYAGGFDEMFGSFGTQARNGSWDVTKMAWSMHSIVNASKAGKTVLVHAFPGPATTPFGPINGSDEHMAIPSWGGPVPRPVELTAIKSATAARLVESLAPFLIVANPTVFFSYAWFYDLNSGYYDCGRFDPLSCTAPSGWFPEFAKPLGPPKADASVDGTVWTRAFEHAEVYVDLLDRSASKITWHGIDQQAPGGAAVSLDRSDSHLVHQPAAEMVVDCYLRTDIEPAKCAKDPRFELYQLHPNNTWSAPDTGINCCGRRGGSAIRGAPEPFGLGISLVRCERACESNSNCTGIIVTKPFNASCLPSHVQTCPDRCDGAPTRCSPEICDLSPGQVSRLKPGTYYHDRQIFLPRGSGILGAGINQTFILACGRQLASQCNMTQRRGFLMGDHTYVGNFTFTGRENKRSGCPLGGGMIETPGCQGDYCGLHKNPPPGAPLCNPPERNLEQCIGVRNATAEYIHLDSWTMDHVGWFPPTVPWGKGQTSGSTNITLRNLTSWGSWADGINFHGGHKYGLVENCEISYTGDDLYAHWPQSTFRAGFEKQHDPRDCSDHIIFRNNIGRYPRFGGQPSTICGTDCSPHTNPCFSLWGSGANMAIIDNHCEEADGPVAMHNSYTNTKNIQMWCGPIAVDGNSYSNPGYCSAQHCQAEGDDRICFSAGSWPTDGTLGGDAGCNRSRFLNKTVPHASLPSDFREELWKGLPSVAFPELVARSAPQR